MAKRSRLALLPLAAGLGAACPAHAAWDFTPVAAARATYSDNVALLPEDRSGGGMVLQMTPGFQLLNHSARFDLSFNYALSLYEYSGSRRSGALRHSQDLDGKLKSRLVEELLYLDAGATIRQQATSLFGPLSSGNDYLRTNRNEVRTYRVSPYLVHRFGAFANGELRYARDSVSTDNIGMRRSDGNTLSAQLTSGPTFRRFGWDASVMRSVIDEQLPEAGGGERQQNTSSKAANLNLRYAVSPTLNLGVFGGYDDYDYSGLGGSQSGVAYGGNLQWTPSARTSIQATAGHRFYGPSYSLALQHRSRGTVWNVAYSDSVSTTRSQFLLPQAVNTASMLDNLFRAQIPDAQLRAAAVAAYIQSAGLPKSLATSVNFLSNRYSLMKQFNAAVGWQLARTTSTLSVFKTKREMLSSQQVDSRLLGSSLSTLNDNTDQLGVLASVSYKPGAQTVLTLIGNAINAKSLSDARSSHQRDLHLNLARTYSSRTSGSVELRHVRGSTGLGGQQYTENAVAAAITTKF
ncbi:TIGR03016 family PEP-CTERM system-associated outer membrane protein [Pseudoduganella violaceinigra]|uniref:TIGR03016 family PEP-CTERM system-associated outer membrane protein n=1 Tax=Pseudoduganella violaceinigra TaxID=246602 RepID=UPI00047FA319|nr:TIGR03016 family PEP-CTERM system-associated outer membrane protein [Pseudoduganella violaceinigra]